MTTGCEGGGGHSVRVKARAQLSYCFLVRSVRKIQKKTVKVRVSKCHCVDIKTGKHAFSYTAHAQTRLFAVVLSLALPLPLFQ
jgi:hypothetical protein